MLPSSLQRLNHESEGARFGNTVNWFSMPSQPRRNTMSTRPKRVHGSVNSMLDIGKPVKHSPSNGEPRRFVQQNSRFLANKWHKLLKSGIEWYLAVGILTRILLFQVNSAFPVCFSKKTFELIKCVHGYQGSRLCFSDLCRSNIVPPRVPVL